MFDVLSSLNWLAVLVAGIAYYVLGGLWFSQAVFGKLWDKAIGFDRPKQWKPTPIYYIGPLVGCLVSAVAVAWLAAALGVNTIGDAVALGLITGVGFGGAVTYTNAISPKTPQPLAFGTIVGVYHVFGIVLASTIIFWWQ